jgi:Na+/H+ antiporter NhaC
MAGMMNTIWLIVCAMSFGAVMERAGLLERLIRSVLAAAKSTGSLIVATLATALGVNSTCADQYPAIVLPGRIYRPEYARRGLDPVNLSRALEDAGTVTSPLVPWNTCGAFMAHGGDAGCANRGLFAIRTIQPDQPDRGGRDGLSRLQNLASKTSCRSRPPRHLTTPALSQPSDF